jgi:diaminohydroxyphosphoribosylaminopyrimidine deaminase/5-amino-6-(5-phosphoribosylamino)uracil reductase
MARAREPWSADDRRFMAMAFAEARKVKGATLPNPAVGAVVVKAGKSLGRGGTRPAGQSHAEVVALKKAGKGARGSTLYVTLEPCSHHGRTPPCTDAIIAAGVRRVIIAVADANPRVKGGGARILARAGIDVKLGLMREEAADFYAGFFFQAEHGRPKIILKIAQSLDGRVNARPGQETALTGREARVFTHGLRARVDAVLVGGRTLRVDDPDLTPWLLKGATHPEALVLSRRGPFPGHLKLFARGRRALTVVAAESAEGLPDWVKHVALTGNGQVTAGLLSLFEERGYHSVLVEGGPEIWALFLSAGLCDTLYVLTAPKLLPAGERWDAAMAAGAVGDWGKSFKFRKLTALGEDFMVEFERSDSPR